ncbi:aldo/keto reductase [Micromonospora endophytica]|uniref:Aldo/keto reductase n=1 Tax=Micromonospora endophytica TaxID=515350 RepID=A0A2W2DFD0_9ACTN|nr:aldo/keto reductase [Micromonospora endophytica]PZF99469.1 aldo/keto reductase [Micromonospora endophytica]RIW40269.1 aldo/keto reductase [Micromonospora endophytica]BCJ58135.1 oxidoreductase [Micromonospora endophytica]
MQTREFGRLGTVSALTLGGGGIGGVWGATEQAEAVATVRAAIDAGITMLDLAPTYGDDYAAERVAGVALRAMPSADTLITSKIELPEQDGGNLPEKMIRSLHATLDRLGREHLDLFLLHSQLHPPGWRGPTPRTLGWELYQDQVVPTFERLRDEGKIRAWGLTGVGHPQTVIDAMRQQPRPDAVQTVVNALDLSGDMWLLGSSAEPRNDEIRRVAVDAGVSVIAIRAVAAGALTTGIDRPVDDDAPVAVDFAQSERFRALADEFGESPASLAHRYALSVPGVATVVLGVKNRTELAECLAAEARGPLTEAEQKALLDLRPGAADPTRG